MPRAQKQQASALIGIGLLAPRPARRMVRCESRAVGTKLLQRENEVPGGVDTSPSQTDLQGKLSPLVNELANGRASVLVQRRVVKQVNKPARQQASKSTSQQASKPAHLLSARVCAMDCIAASRCGRMTGTANKLQK